MYNTLARLYDRFMDDVNYAAWARYYVEICRSAGTKAEDICECACGTGSLTVEIARYAKKYIASDLSEDMLRVASAKARKRGLRVPFIRMDMKELVLPHKVDTIIACCDGMNYLTKDEDALAFMQRAYASLKEGGVLAFDVSTQAKMEAMDKQVWCDERDDAACIWHTAYDRTAKILTMDVSMYIRKENDLFERSEEQHIQIARSKEELESLLTQAGFTDMRFYGDMKHNDVQPQDMRMHCTAQKHTN